MICAWQSLLNILPIWMRSDVDRLGNRTLQEIRMHLNAPPILRMQSGSITLKRRITAEDMHFCVNTASRYSPWTAATVTNGYITSPGGHRIGICGKTAATSGCVTSLNGLTSLCLRVARDYPGIAAKYPKKDDSVLIIGAPGCGKTTLLRDLIRNRSNAGYVCAVVDEREEIFPRENGQFCFPVGIHTDVLSGCKKTDGIENVLRTMGPEQIAIDEITSQEDCLALLHSGWCGVNLLATAHAGSREDLLNRQIYRPIIENKLFDTIIILSRDKSWYAERLDVCT